MPSIQHAAADNFACLEISHQGESSWSSVIARTGQGPFHSGNTRSARIVQAGFSPPLPLVLLAGGARASGCSERRVPAEEW